MSVSSESLFCDGVGVLREEFVYAVEVARALHDPATEWDAFRDVLWEYLTRVFGIDDPTLPVGPFASSTEEGAGWPRYDGATPVDDSRHRSAATPPA